MKLDSRILKGKRPLTCFDIDEARMYVGKKCYICDEYDFFYKLALTEQTILTGVEDCEVPFHYDSDKQGEFCLPAEWVKEEPTPKHIDFEVAKKDKNFERCDLYGEELLFDTKNNIFYTSDGNVHAYLTTMAQHRYNEEQTKEVIIEKKYRPYSMSEWIEQHEIGDIIHYRSKNGTELRHMYLGTRHRPEYKMLTLGDSSYSLDCLFEEYEIEVDGEWLPFGVLDE